MTLSAAFTVEGVANPAAHHVAFGSTVDLALTSTDGAVSIVWEIMGCSEPSEPIPAITPAGNPEGRTASFVFPADSADTLGRTFLVRCTTSNQVRGADGEYEMAREYAVIGAENSQGELPFVPGEKNYRHGTHGWTPEINRLLNSAGGGGGGGGGGGWTDDGSVVRLTSSSDSVAIGTASLSGTEKLRVVGSSRFEQVVATTGNPKALYVSGAAHTTLSAGGEIIDVDFALDRTVQHATGAVTSQRAFVVRAPTYSFVGASVVTDAATLAITGAPAAGTNATLTNSYAFWVQGGAVRLGALTAGVVVASATGVLSSVTGTALQVLRWNSGGTALEFANPGSSLSAPSNPADDGKVAVAAAGNLNYTLLSNVHIASGAAIALTKLATIATDRLLGRDTALTGTIEELTVGGGVEFTGSGGIQRSALTGDVTAAAGSNTTAIAAGVIVDADVNASAGIAHTKLATIATDRIMGRDTAGTGAIEALTVGGNLEFSGAGGIQRGALTGDVTATAGSGVTAIAAGVIVDADINASAGITLTKLATIATDRILGRDTAGTGTLEQLTVSGGLEFSGSGGIQRSAISGDITIAASSGTAAITADVIVDADINTAAGIQLTKLASGAATSVVGRSAGTTGAYADIAALSDDQVLRRSGGVLGFGSISIASVSGDLPVSQIADIAALTVLANATNATAAPTAVAAASDYQVFRRTGLALAFGAMDLSQAGAVGTSKLGLANFADLAGLSVLGRSAATSGVTAAITGADGQVLRVSGTTLGFGTIVTAGIADNAITLAKLAQQAGLSVLANVTNLTAVPSAVAAASDGLVFLRSGTTLAFGTIVTAGITDAAVTYAKIASGVGLSLLGRSVNSVGVNADIVAANDGDIMRRSGTSIGFGSISGAGLTDATVTLAKLVNLAGLSVLGRSANTTGVMAAITGTDGQVLRVSGTALGFGTIVTAGIADAAVTYAKIANGTGLSVVGRAGNTAGVNADIVGTDGQILRVSGTTLGFGTIATAGLADNSVTLAKLATQAALTVLANATNATAVPTAVVAATDGFVFRRSGTTLGWGLIVDANITTGTITFAKIGNGTALSVMGRSANSSGVMGSIAGTLGQVLRVGTGPLLGFGSLDLSLAATVGTSLLQLANFTPGSSGHVLTTVAGVPAWGTALGNSTDAFTIDGANIVLKAGGANKLLVTTSVFEFYNANLKFHETIVAPQIYQEPDPTAGVTCDTLTIIAQSASGTGATTGGRLSLKGGASTTGTGGELNLYTGDGVTDGAFNLHTGGNLRLKMNASGEFNFQDNNIITTGVLFLGSDPAETGRIRLSNNDQINWESNPAGTDIPGLTVNASNQVVLGGTAVTRVHIQAQAYPSVGYGVYIDGSEIELNGTGSDGITISNTDGIVDVFASDTIYLQATSLVSIAAGALANVAMFGASVGFNGGTGTAWLNSCGAVPSAQPSAGAYVYVNSGSLEVKGWEGGTWQVSARSWSRKYFEGTGSTASMAATTIMTQSMTTLPADCGGVIRVYTEGQDATTVQGAASLVVMFRKNAGVFTYLTATTEGGTSSIGTLNAGVSGGSLIIQITAVSATARTYKTLLECTYNIE